MPFNVYLNTISIKRAGPKRLKITASLFFQFLQMKENLVYLLKKTVLWPKSKICNPNLTAFKWFLFQSKFLILIILKKNNG